VAACASTGLGAGVFGYKTEVISHVAAAKRSNADSARERLRREVGEKADRQTKDVEELSEAFQADWLAVIHIDGNGIGRILKEFQKKLADAAIPNEEFANRYKDFCRALSDCATEAFTEAVNSVPSETQKSRKGTTREIFAILPLVFGGDDLTVVVPASEAFGFATTYQRAYERITADNQTIKDGLSDGDVTSLTSSAGIAIVKPKYPLYAAYALADELTSNAKNKAKSIESIPGSFLDVHVLHDSIALSINDIRKQKMSIPPHDKDRTLWGGPYLVADPTKAADIPYGVRDVCELDKRLAALSDSEDGKRTIARGLVKRIRDEAFLDDREIHQNTLKELLSASDRKHPIEVFIESMELKSIFSEHGSTAFLDAVALYDVGVRRIYGTQEEQQR
jgi:hypothetical protein